MRKIYIITTFTGTFLSRIITRAKQIPYAHVSVALNKELKPMFSFGRLHPKTPIFAGFVEENINEGLYKNRPNTMCRVYSINVTEAQYEKLQRNIKFFSLNRKNYKYDAKGLVYLYLKKERTSSNKYVCSNFVAEMLYRSDIKILDKEPHLVQPDDFFDLKNSTLEYEGLLCDYSTNSQPIAL